MTAVTTVLLALSLAAGPPPAGKYFQIRVVDDQTGRGVPLVELRTVNNIRLWTDSAGLAAFYEPGLMNGKVFFFVKSHGYKFPKDGFGFRGKTLDVSEGGEATLNIRRINIAHRLYRVTGAGIYADSLLVGRPAPVKSPLLNAQVFGSDSVVNTVYRGKIYWFWGDTNRPRYPLGNFHVPGATSRLPEDGGLDVETGVDLQYFVDDAGFAKETAKMPGKGPTWIGGLVVAPDRDGRDRLYASYVKVRGFLDVYQRGLVVFDDSLRQFKKVRQFDMQAPVHPAGHPLKHSVDDVQYVYFANPYPLVRVRARGESLARLSQYEAYTCLAEGTRVADAKLDRDAQGNLRYRWKKNTPPLSPSQQATLIDQGRMRRDEAQLRLKDAVSGKSVAAHGGSVYWNDYRRRWVMIALEAGGDSPLGEIWYAEADTLEGPWVYARKIITHDRYSFYNPKQHPMFDKSGGRLIFLEGTYTNMFSGNPGATPRYNYNQIMYKLDLADARLALPVPVYHRTQQGFLTSGDVEQFTSAGRHPPGAFFAPDRQADRTVPVYHGAAGAEALRLYVGSPPAALKHLKPRFYALPADSMDPPATTTPLYEFISADDQPRVYSIDKSPPPPGFRRTENPVCLVWKP